MPRQKKPDREKNRMAGRIRRYATVGGKLSGVAATAAASRFLGIEVDKSKEAAALKSALGGLKGPLMKIAQILGTIPDAVPEEYVAELRQLQSAAPSMGWPFVRRRMSAELGADWQKKFAQFEQTAIAAASLGQVHKATTVSGETVACKLQYPDMQSAVDADLRQLKLILGIYQKLDGAIDTSQVFDEIAARLREELDYRREAKHIRLYETMLSGQSDVHLPTPIESLSTGRLLTMRWLDGQKILDFQNRKLADRNQISRTMFNAWYVPFYRYGIIHGDPHLGNYSITPDLHLNLLDFGCVRIFSADFVAGVIDLYRALCDKKPELAVEAYKKWGFKNLSRELIAVLNIWAEFLYGPIMQDKVLKLSETNNGVYGRETAARVHRELRQIGGVRPPPEFVFMDRAAVGLGSVFIHLNAEINWYRLFHDVIGDFNAKQLAKSQQSLLGAAGLHTNP